MDCLDGCDPLLPGTLHSVVFELAEHPGVDVVYKASHRHRRQPPYGVVEARSGKTVELAGIGKRRQTSIGVQWYPSIR